MEKTKPAIVKNSRAVEAMLFQASEFLLDASRFELAKWSKEDYEKDLRLGQLTESMLELEAIASAHGAKSGFWRRLKKVAVQLELDDKIEDYEKRYHQAVSINSE